MDSSPRNCQKPTFPDSHQRPPSTGSLSHCVYFFFVTFIGQKPVMLTERRGEMVNISHYWCLPFCGLKYTVVKATIKQILQAVNEMKENFSCYFHTWYQSTEKCCNFCQFQYTQCSWFATTYYLILSSVHRLYSLLSV